MADTECVVVGAGAVGLAIARALALAGREVVVLEAGDRIGSETSSRSSEVIHAGLYYPTGSLKHRLCVTGREQLYRFCAENGVPHKKLGKLVVASEEAQRPDLAKLAATADRNGVQIVPLTAGEVHALEPAVRAVAGLLSPETGIVDSHALMLAYQGEAEAHGAVVALRSPVVRGKTGPEEFVLEVGGDEPARLSCRVLVNAAGLGAETLSRAIAGIKAEAIPRIRFARGVYFTLRGPQPFGRLIYPMPDAATLGVHVTLDLAGRARFGPDIEWIERIDYAVDPGRAAQFAAAIRSYWPGLPEDALEPGYAGIRPKLQAPGEPARDFLIQGPQHHGVPGYVALYGIESPGLTSSLAIGEMVREIIACGVRGG
ncbi:MAG TPA: NAD(P)/FAD-dependent oxidoreductase [Methylomirabilota bacterium]|jgi:L-2-hydroxyglutarate oxidase LhgO|nr:NAD(P)/FAD-dependent oxidoreductase [Methylomirabilota bacterium]